MMYQKLGKSQLDISRVSFGCMSLEKETAENLVHAAIDGGINFFDTADLYGDGENEKWLGKAIANRRSKLIIATKVGNQRVPGKGSLTWNPRKEYILSAVENSLKRLNTDYIDLYQLHGGTTDDPTDETIQAFETLVQAGKIRYYGISSIRPNVISRWIGSSNMVSVMMQYSLLDSRPEESALPALQAAGIGVLARGSVAGGLLAGKPAKDYLQHPAAVVQQAAIAVAALAKGSGLSAATIAIAYALSKEAITSAVVGIRTQKQLQDALAAGAAPLPISTREVLEEAVPKIMYLEHRS